MPGFGLNTAKLASAFMGGTFMMPVVSVGTAAGFGPFAGIVF